MEPTREELIQLLKEANFYVEMCGDNCYNPVADRLKDRIDEALKKSRGEE